MQESGERTELGQVPWKCKRGVGSGEVERKSPQNMMPRCGRKESKDKDGFSFSSLSNSERAGTVQSRKQGSQGVAVRLGADTPSQSGTLPLLPPPFSCQKQEWPPLTPLCLFSQKLYLNRLKVLCCLKGVLNVVTRK